MTAAAASNPFSRRTALGLVAFGIAAFFALLWIIGSNLTQGERNDGQAHAGSNSLIGFSAMAKFLDARGYDVRMATASPQLRQDGLLVLTPPLSADPKELGKIVEDRRMIGPTLLIMPKWQAIPQTDRKLTDPEGWVRLTDPTAPEWRGFYDNITLSLDPIDQGPNPGAWHGINIAGNLPRKDAVLSGEGDGMVPMIVGDDDGFALVSYSADGGDYPALRDFSLYDEPRRADEEGGIVVKGAPSADQGKARRLYPVIFVFEPDLLNNQGFAALANAQLAEKLAQVATYGGERSVTFDLTLNGFAQSDNLLTLAFTPPYLAATLCLMLAALITFWRAFNRFGPPLSTGPAIAFGKRALVTNAAGLIQRARRFHLVGTPYADAARDRLAKALALPQRLDPAATEAAIDRALAARAPGSMPFSAAAAALRAARRPVQLLRAAQTLHSLERILTK